MNPLFVSPVKGGASFQPAAIVDSADRAQKKKEHFQMSLGERASLLHSLVSLFVLALPLNFSPYIVGSYSVSLWSFVPGVPSHLFLF